MNDENSSDDLAGFLKYVGSPVVSPRTAAALSAVLHEELNRARAGLDRKRFEIFEWLPPLVMLMRGTDEAWLRRFVEEGEVAVRRLEDGSAVEGNFVQNMAQQFWIDGAISVAEDPETDAPGISAEVFLDQLPGSESDFDWEWAREVLLPDLDHLYLYDEEMDEIAFSEKLAVFGIGNELDPDHWFDPFWGGS